MLVDFSVLATTQLLTSFFDKKMRYLKVGLTKRWNIVAMALLSNVLDPIPI